MRASHIALLRDRLPEAAWPPVEQWLRDNKVEVRVVRARSSKLGDYRSAHAGRPARVTINHGMNPYASLVTLIHEFAHHAAFTTARGSEPHGVEWKSEYKRLMKPFLSLAVLPPDVLTALHLHLLKAPASSCADPRLMRTLHRHDPVPALHLERLPERALFHFQNGIYVKGPRLRKRFRCECLSNRRTYLMDPLIEVRVHDPAEVAHAS